MTPLTPQSPVLGNALNPALILVVDDEISLLTVVGVMLRKSGYSIIQASGPQAALEILQTLPIDLLLTDVLMPGPMNGADLAKAARIQNPSLPVIFMSGQPAGILDKANLPFPIKLLTKPFAVSDLVRMVAETLPPGSPALSKR